MSGPQIDLQGPSFGNVVVTQEADAFASPEPAEALLPRRKPRFPWGKVFGVAFGGLVTLGIGLWADRLIADLFATYPALGVAASVLTAIALLALLVVVGREVMGVWRERHVEGLRKRATAVLVSREDDEARALTREIVLLYKDRPTTAAGRAALDAEDGTLIDADDRLAMAERLLLAPLDLAAKRQVANVARQVSLVTAVSPRALVDVAFTFYASARLVRRIAAIYGGRPGFFGFLRLARSVAGNLVVTGGVAAGDSLLQQAIGHGLAARLSAKAGEGMLNGLLTARIGIAAIDVCRPLPFLKLEPPRVADIAGELLSRTETAP